ncbi:hypothetical protein LTR10_016370 [Elasticomyces elasticus]|uniref:J domain-containing protein n=1 Tax=Exophiala sideris TaxID=1016849 RepID=A0ABR0J635_9EURO|nr:hypothetical protein LTR10_016370 [Elasticomyces elasticus]KAK5028380.1 hypothetical protein LTS07_006471 [Exophiala sideris]KAK5035977.1 hypothetical protein LTR13_005547 [Exophiala sideris]KAK5057013.1 hypothetical protein LTR69_007651 [Exophiala sideris]KAK5181420.1 hypothetical protein LTR44_006215 [Eurotiomycetes sp. CCFEE 6388]
MLIRPASLPSSVCPLRRTITSPSTKCLVDRARAHGRHFSQTPAGRQSGDAPNHYDVLHIKQTATAAELKKQFYVLSKETHPDRNRNDPKASERFAQISESYSVLANPEKRKRYDRDVMRVHSHRHSHGSHSSHQRSTYAGHRPATGLSKRRSAFKGPPPSFYAHGKPSANTTNQAQASQAGPQPHMGGTFNTGAYTEDGRFDPAFDPQSTYKTQTHEDYRRANRRAAELAAAEASVEADNFWGRFIVVSAIIILGVSVGTIVVSMANSPRGGLTRADGSRRDGPRNDWTKG